VASRQVMAFDLGASNGRAIVGDFNYGKIVLHEVHRFNNDAVKLGNYLYWDFPRLFHELKTALVKAKNMGFVIESVGVDTWGVDYGLIDEEGDLITNPVNYRDDRAAAGMKQLLESFTKDELKLLTGMDCVTYNTVNQLINDKFLARGHAKAMLNMPDLFNFFLTGIYSSEYSMATTTQLYDYENKTWNWPLISKLELDPTIFQKVISSGTIVGDVKEDLLEELNMPSLKVSSVTSHDTAAAVRAVPTDGEEFLFIATGTWVIVGSKQKSVTMNDQVMAYDLTNEGGKFPHVNLLKNHVGLWMLQESKKYWEKAGHSLGFGDLVDMAEKVSVKAHVDITDERFFEPGNMPLKIQDYCRESHQEVPDSIGEIVLVIEQSLAKQIAESMGHIELATGKAYEEVYVFGGGVQDRLLLRLIGEYSGKKVVVGPKEATAFGNVLDQMIALDILKEDQRIKVLKASM